MELCRSQIYKRSNQETNRIENILSNTTEQGKGQIIKNLIKNNPDILNSDQKYLTENDVMELITDNNLSDSCALKILQKLRLKFGNNVVTKNIARKLTDKKKVLDTFFTCRWLDENSTLHFKSKCGKVLGRYVVYCHDIPGLLAFKKLIHDTDDLNIMNVIGVDEGKGILKMVWNCSQIENDVNRIRLMGPKRAIVLTAVARVPETHHNLSVLMELTKPYEVEYTLSHDLKLANILAVIQSHSSKYPCVYGECTREEKTGRWIKGRNRTSGNIEEHRKEWILSGGSRDNLKNHMNCEHKPLLSSINPSTPILVQLPPPPLHTILLGIDNIIYHNCLYSISRSCKSHHEVSRISESRSGYVT